MFVINKKLIKSIYLIFFLLCILILLCYLLNTPQVISQDSNLSFAVNDCETIADKSVMNLPEFLEFQRLEKTGRKARVMQLCMKDRGYQVNPAWIKSHRQKAYTLAEEQNISRDAAMEEMLRSEMYSIPTTNTLPIWTQILSN